MPGSARLFPHSSKLNTFFDEVAEDGIVTRVCGGGDVVNSKLPSVSGRISGLSSWKCSDHESCRGLNSMLTADDVIYLVLVTSILLMNAAVFTGMICDRQLGGAVVG